MEKLNLPKYYVGLKVEFLESTNFHDAARVPAKHTVHIITLCYFKPSSGQWLYVLKGFELDKDGDRQGFCAKILRPVQEQKFPLMTFEKIKETEKEEILIPN